METIKSLEKQIEKIKDSLYRLGDMHTGRLSTQYNVCGSKACRCKDPENPKKHRPYDQLSYVHRGKSTSRFIKKEQLPEIKKQVANYQKFIELTTEWKALAADLGEIKIKVAGGKIIMLRTRHSQVILI